MNKMKFSAIALVLASSSAFSGTMGAVVAPERLLLIEGGLSYSHIFMKSRVVTPESRVPAFPNGVVVNLQNFYPECFFGGYMGASLYMADWLINNRLDLYGQASKHNAPASTRISVAPAKFSLTLDRVFGDINSLSYGIGAGAVLRTNNEGEFIVNPGNNAFSETIQGRARFDPQVEAFAMYRMDNGFGVKFNAGYQIPVNDQFSNGSVNLNLGVNYAFPV